MWGCFSGEVGEVGLSAAEERREGIDDFGMLLGCCAYVIFLPSSAQNALKRRGLGTVFQSGVWCTPLS